MEQEQITKKYWFKPARFWNYFAFYYPVSLEGWAVTIVFIAALIRIFIAVDHSSHSGSDTLINFIPLAIIVMIIFDALCLRFGEYPWWWRRNK